MTLPFSLDEFLDVFAAYNRLLWPGALLLWIAGVVALVLFLRRDHRATKVMGWTLVAQWAWSGAAYHLAFFRAINPVAVAFGALFLVQAGLLAWWTLRATPTAFPRPTSMWGRIGVVLIGYALAYPLLGLALGLDYPRLPTFGVPCPTTLFTVGALLVARETAPRWLGLIPLAWTAVGGSAAFLFGIHADLALPVAGTVLLMSMVLPRGRTQVLAALAAIAAIDAMFTADARSYPSGAAAAIGLSERGTYVNVWNREGGGWRIQSKMWNADAPAAGPVPP